MPAPIRIGVLRDVHAAGAQDFGGNASRLALHGPRLFVFSRITPAGLELFPT